MFKIVNINEHFFWLNCRGRKSFECEGKNGKTGAGPGFSVRGGANIRFWEMFGPWRRGRGGVGAVPQIRTLFRHFNLVNFVFTTSCFIHLNQSCKCSQVNSRFSTHSIPDKENSFWENEKWLRSHKCNYNIDYRLSQLLVTWQKTHQVSEWTYKPFSFSMAYWHFLPFCFLESSE